MTALRARARLLPTSGVPLLSLQDGPIDLIVLAEGSEAARRAAWNAAAICFGGILDRLCAELPLLRTSVAPGVPWPADPIARRMRAAVEPLARFGFITPMAAVAGAVAEAVLAAMVAAAPLRRAAVNNGGDIALHLEPGERFATGMVARPVPGAPDLFGRVVLRDADRVRGIATSGWRGRSFSLGIADAVTVLAARAAAADAAATVIANAVDLPGHPAVQRCPATDLQPDSDLGERPVTHAVGALAEAEIATALDAGLRRAEALVAACEIIAAALHLQGRTVLTAAAGDPLSAPGSAADD